VGGRTTKSHLSHWSDDRENTMNCERKLELFPEDKRQIESAEVVMVGNDYRIEVASTTV